MKSSFRFLVLFLAVIAIPVIVLMLPRQAETVSPETVKLALRERVETPAERAFEQELEEIGASLEGQLGIAVTDVATGRSYDFNGDDMMPQQSVSKLWVAMTALNQVDEGALDLAERVSIRREDLTLFYQPIRNIVRERGSFNTTFSDLMQRAIARSDNTANDRLLRRVGGPDAVQAWLDENDIFAVRFGADERTKQSKIAGLQWRQRYSYRDEFYKARDRVPDAQRREAFEFYLAGPSDGASALAISSALARLARGELLSPRSTRLLRGILAQTKSGPRRLKAGAPEGWSVEHKTGTGQVLEGEQAGYNDVGILTSPDGREYSVAVLIGRTREPIAARMEMMQAVSRAVAGFDAALHEQTPERLARADER